MLSADGRSVKIGIFVNGPYDELVREGSRFWNASGVNLKLTAGGLELNTESIVSVLIGGIAFDLPPGRPRVSGQERMRRSRCTQVNKRHLPKPTRRSSVG